MVEEGDNRYQFHPQDENSRVIVAYPTQLTM